jgi:hypothetical protein
MRKEEMFTTHVKIHENVADVLSKALGGVQYDFCVRWEYADKLWMRGSFGSYIHTCPPLGWGTGT